jgi:RAD51-like protein 1
LSFTLFSNPFPFPLPHSLNIQATRQLQRIGLDDNLLRRLRDKNILTARDLFSKTLLDLVELLDLPYHTIHLILAQVAAKITPAPCTALDMLQSSLTRPYTHLPTGLPLLDSSLHGGIPAGSITEIVGPAGLGKTQFCLTLSIMAVQAGGVVMYIDTEKKVSAERLLQIAQARSSSDNDSDTISSLLERVMLICPPDSSSLLNQLNNLESTIIDHKVSFIIIDSIASLARADRHSSIPDRQRMLGQQAAQLKYLSETFSIPVLVVNQVTTMINNITTTSGGGGGKLIAALGPAWAHSVNTRLVVESVRSTAATTMGDNDKDDTVNAVRILRIVKSPASPAMAMAYQVTKAGIEPAPEGTVVPPLAALEGNVVDQEIMNELAHEQQAFM